MLLPLSSLSSSLNIAAYFFYRNWAGDIGIRSDMAFFEDLIQAEKETIPDKSSFVVFFCLVKMHQSMAAKGWAVAGAMMLVIAFTAYQGLAVIFHQSPWYHLRAAPLRCGLTALKATQRF